MEASPTMILRVQKPLLRHGFIFTSLFSYLLLFNLSGGVRVTEDEPLSSHQRLSSVSRRQSSNNNAYSSSFSSSGGQGSSNGVSSTSTELALSDMDTINFVLVISDQNELPVYYEMIKPTLEIALKDVARKYPHLKFNLVPIKDHNKCADNVLGALAAEKYYTSKVNVFIGPICTYALDAVARMASYWNVPVFTAGGIGVEFSNKRTFTTLTRMSFSLDRVSHFMVKIFREYDWHHVSLIVDETEAANTLVRSSMQAIFKEAEFGYEITFDVQSFSRKEANVTVDYKRLLRQSSRAARIIVLVTTGELTRQMLIDAYDLGMGNGDYVFFGVELVKQAGSASDFSWYKPGDKRNKIAREMYESLLMLAVRVPTSAEYTSFTHKVTKASSEEFGGIANSDNVNPIVAAFYDCVTMFTWAYNYTLAIGGDIRDGRSMVRRLWNFTFPNVGLTGDILMNDNGDREVDYTLNDLDPETGTMRPVATYFGARRILDKLPGVEIHWPKSKGPPPDVPDCGFTGEAAHCQPKEAFPIWASILITFVVVTIVALAVSLFVYKKIRLEQDLNDNWWKISYEDINFVHQRGAGGGHKSAMSMATSETDGYQSGKTSSLKAGSIGHSLISAAGELDTVLVGIYKGVRIAFKPLNIKRLMINRQLLMEVKQMKDILHENLVRFIGLCIDEPNYATVNELMIRGSLRDLLETEKIQIDWTFKYSMLTDIVEGMLFLHGSLLDYHGHLKSTNCVVDGRFMVKITDYGIRSLHAQITREQETASRALLWTSPEILRSKDPLNTGSKKGDIYSFAIILQEIITRCPPFESLERLGRKKIVYEPNEILDRVRMGTVPPFRPEVAPDECSKELLTLMHECWAEQPASRPDFVAIKPRLRKITQGISSRNFLDNLLNRMEQYSQNLERIVEEKTQSVIEEKQKTEELLYQLLPRFIADELKRGAHVKPESYDCVTIFFSDIVGFTALSAESSPIQVVDLLNDLYSCFDAIIDIHDVYKVETIGDAYMVASGLPIRNGNDHAKEIALMAINLRKAVSAFKIRHMPKRKLQLRIGVHSGPCVAGVVGLKMPKYCLFGDTVNTASRMETHGEPLKIHISEATKSLLDTFHNVFVITSRGEVEIKGKGKMVTYWLESERKGVGVGNPGAVGGAMSYRAMMMESQSESLEQQQQQHDQQASAGNGQSNPPNYLDYNNFGGAKEQHQQQASQSLVNVDVS